MAATFSEEANTGPRSLRFTTRLLHCGPLEKREKIGIKRWLFKWCELRGNIFYYFEERDLDLLDPRRCSPKGEFTLDADVVVSMTSELQFQLDVNKPGRVKTVVLRALTAAMARNWVTILDDVTKGVIVEPSPEASAYCARDLSGRPRTQATIDSILAQHGPLSTTKMIPTAKMTGFLRIVGPLPKPVAAKKLRALKYNTFYFVYAKSVLYYYESGMSEEPSGQMTLEGVVASLEDLEPFITIHLLYKEDENSFYLEADDENLCQEWLNVFKESGKELRKSTSSLIRRKTLPGTRNFPKRQLTAVTGVVSHDYEKQGKDELTLKVGDELVDIRPTEEEGWSLGFSKVVGYGLFPVAFVELNIPETTAIGGTKGTSIKPHKAERIEDLSFPAGVLITDVCPTEKMGWVQGVYQGVRGRFPLAYVDISQNSQRSAPVGTGYTVISDYEFAAQEVGEISFPAGVVITDVVVTEDAEWLEGLYSGKRGIFPANFVTRLKEEENRVMRAKTDYTAAGKAELTLVTGTIIENVKDSLRAGYYDGLSRGKRGMFPVSVVEDVPATDIVQCAIGIRFFRKEISDDLEIEVGRVVFEVFDAEDVGWLRGWTKGSFGVFPANHTVLFKVVKAPSPSQIIVLAGEATKTACSPYYKKGLDEFGTALSFTGCLPASVEIPPWWLPTASAEVTKAAEEAKRASMAAAALARASVRASRMLPVIAEPDLLCSMHVAPLQAAVRTVVGKGNVAIGVYEFEAEVEDELTFKIGTIITGVVDATEPGWAMGNIGVIQGIFPKSHVCLLAIDNGALTNFNALKFSLESSGGGDADFIKGLEAMKGGGKGKGEAGPSGSVARPQKAAAEMSVKQLTAFLTETVGFPTRARETAELLHARNIRTIPLLSFLTSASLCEMGLTSKGHIALLRAYFSQKNTGDDFGRAAAALLDRLKK